MRSIKEPFLNNPLVSKAVPIALSIWILSLTAYYCINTPWLSFLSSGRPDTKELIAETLKFNWVFVFLSRIPYVFYALILNFIALLMGNRILRWLKADFDSLLNKIIFSVPLGWSVYSLGIFYLGIFGLLYKEAVYCFLTLLGVLSILEIERFFKPPHPNPLPRGERIGEGWFKIDKTDPESSSGQALIFLPVIILFLAVQLVMAFSPVWSFDPLFYHMALPKLYIKHHALVHVRGFYQSTFPAHTEMLYLLGLITSGETLSKLFSFSISSIFLVSIFSIGSRYFSKWVGYLVVFITMFSVPYFFPLFSEPWIDTALGLFSLLGVYAFFMWIEGRKEGYLYLSIIFCALAAATKIQGLFLVPLFFVGFLVTLTPTLPLKGEGRVGVKQFFKKLALCVLAVGIIALPWYIRNWWLTGDPIFPFLYKYLGASTSGGWNDYSNECFWAYHSMPGLGGAKSLSDFIRINKDLFFSGKISIYSLSPIIVIFLIPAFLTLRNWTKLMRYLFFVTFVCYIFFIFTSPQIRYYYVGFTALGIIIAQFVKTVWTKYSLTRIPIILCIVAFSAASFNASVEMIEGPFFAGLGVLDQRQFLNDAQPHSKGGAWVNENLPQDSKILTWHGHGYHLEREYMLVNPVWQGTLDFGRINDASTFLKSIKESGITHLLYDYGVDFKPNVHVKEFLDKCVSELLESGKIVLIKQIDSYALYSVKAPPDYFVLVGNIIRFNDESQRKYLVKGWSSTEEWGTWSEGEESVILVNLTPTLPSPSKGEENPTLTLPVNGEDIGWGKDYTMLIKATGFSVPDKQQSVKIYLDDNLLGEHTFTQPTTYFEDIEIKIPAATLSLPSPLEGEESALGGGGNHRIRFVYSFTGVPAEHGMGPDLRQLAMGVSSIEFR